jgi:hypothetical protein
LIAVLAGLISSIIMVVRTWRRRKRERRSATT